MLQLGYKIWLDKEGKVFGRGPYELLKGVSETGSLSESAKNMHMSYNKAYNLIKEIERKLGYELLSSKIGGNRGGGSTITVEAEALMEKYLNFVTECENSLKEIFNKHFQI